MKKISGKGLLVALLAFAMLVTAGTVAKAQEGPNFDDIIEGVNISGFATSFYQYNVSKDGPRDPDNTNFGGGRDELAFPNFLMFRDDNSFTLENLEVQIFKEATEEHPVGFGFVTHYGEIARNLTFGGRFPNGDHDNNDEDRFALQAGYVQWLIPIGKGIDFKIGKFATWIGAELIEDVDNPNLTHSQNYNNSIPFTHTGLSLGYALTDSVNVTLFLVNGWDSFTDNNDAKTFGWQVAWAPSDNLSMVLNGIHGAEKPSNNTDTTNLFDYVITYVFNDKLSFLGNFDYGWTENTEDRDDSIGKGGKDAAWYGGALTAIYGFNDWMNLAVRYEYSDYADEFGFSVWETTATLNIKVSENLLIRPEYRHNNYTGDGLSASGEQSDNILAVGFSYIF